MTTGKVGDLSVDISANLAKLYEGLTQAVTAVNGAAAQMSGGLDKISGSVAGIANSFTQLGGVIRTVGAALGVGAFAGFIESAIEGEAELYRLSQRTGATVESLSAMRVAAKLVGTSMDEVAIGTQRFAKNIVEAQSGTGKAAAALQALGLNAKTFVTQFKSTDEALLAYAQALGKYSDGATKTANTMAILGRNGAALIPFLQQLADKGLGAAKVTREQAEAAEHLEQSFAKLSGAVKVIAIAVANTLVPVLQGVVDNLNVFKNIAIAAIGAFVVWPAVVGVATIALNAYKEAVIATALAEEVLGQKQSLTLSLLGLNKTIDSVKTNFLSLAGLLKTLPALLFAGFAGYELGKYIGEQFLSARLFGIEFVEGLLVLWENLKAGTAAAWEYVKFKFLEAVEEMKVGFGKFIALVGEGLKYVPGLSDFSAQTIAFGKSLESVSGGAAIRFKAELANIAYGADQAKKQIRATFEDMRIFEVQQALFKKGGGGEGPKPPAPVPNNVQKSYVDLTSAINAYNRAYSELLVAQSNATGKIQAEAIKNEQADLERSYQQNLIDFESYLNKRTDLQRQANANQAQAAQQAIDLQEQLIDQLKDGLATLQTRQAEFAAGNKLPEFYEKVLKASTDLFKAEGDLANKQAALNVIQQQGAQIGKDYFEVLQKQYPAILTSNKALDDQVKAQQLANETYGLTAAQIQLVIAAKDQELLQNELERNGYTQTAQALEQQIALRQQLAAQIQRGDDIKRYQQAWTDLIRGLTDGFANFFDDLLEHGSSAFKNLWDNFKKWALEAIAKIAAQQVVVSIVGAIAPGAAFAQNATTGGGGPLGTVLEGLFGKFSSLGTAVTGVTASAQKASVAFSDTVGDTQFLGDAMQTTGGATLDVGKSLLSFGSALGSILSSLANKVSSGFSSLFSGGGGGLSDTISRGFNDIFGNASEALDPDIAELSNEFGKVQDEASHLADGLGSASGDLLSFGNLLAGAGIGAAIGGLGAKLFGNERNQTGISIGGTVGGIIGSAVAGPIGAAVGAALGSVLGSFFKSGGGPKTEGFATTGTINLSGTTTFDGRWFSGSSADAALSKTLTTLSDSYKQTIAALGGTAAKEIGFALGYSQDTKGTAPSNVHGGAYVGGQQIYNVANANVGRSAEDVQAELQRQAQQMLLAALQASDLPGAVGKIIGSVDVLSASAEDVANILNVAEAIKAVTAAFPALDEQIAGLDADQIKAFVDALGGADAVAQSFTYLQKNFETTADQTKKQADDLASAFNSLGLQVPATHQAFLDLLSSFDLTTESGRNLYASVIALAPAFVAVAGSADDAAKQLQDATAFFKSNFYSDAEQKASAVAAATKELDAAQTQLGIVIPRTVEAFRHLVEGIDRSTPAGEALYEALLKIAPALITVTGTMKDLAAAAATVPSFDYLSERDKLVKPVEEQYKGLADQSTGNFGDKATLQIKLIAAKIAEYQAAVEDAYNAGDYQAVEAYEGAIVQLQNYNNKLAAQAARFTVLTAQYGDATAEQLVNLEAWYADQQHIFQFNADAMAALNVIFKQKWDAIIKGTSEGVTGTVDELDKLRKAILDYLASLKTSDLSPLTPAQKLAEAQKQYSDILAKAAAGDPQALADVTKFADQYLKAARDFYASSPLYTQIFDQITAQLTALANNKVTPPGPNPTGPGTGPAITNAVQQAADAFNDLTTGAENFSKTVPQLTTGIEKPITVAKPPPVTVTPILTPTQAAPISVTPTFQLLPADPILVKPVFSLTPLDPILIKPTIITGFEQPPPIAIKPVVVVDALDPILLKQPVTIAPLPPVVVQQAVSVAPLPAVELTQPVAIAPLPEIRPLLSIAPIPPIKSSITVAPLIPVELKQPVAITPLDPITLNQAVTVAPLASIEVTQPITVASIPPIKPPITVASIDPLVIKPPIIVSLEPINIKPSITIDPVPPTTIVPPITVKPIPPIVAPITVAPIDTIVLKPPIAVDPIIAPIKPPITIDPIPPIKVKPPITIDPIAPIKPPIIIQPVPPILVKPPVVFDQPKPIVYTPPVIFLPPPAPIIPAPPVTVAPLPPVVLPPPPITFPPTSTPIIYHPPVIFLDEPKEPLVVKPLLELEQPPLPTIRPVITKIEQPLLPPISPVLTGPITAPKPLEPTVPVLGGPNTRLDLNSALINALPVVGTRMVSNEDLRKEMAELRATLVNVMSDVADVHDENGKRIVRAITNSAQQTVDGLGGNLK